MALTLKQVLEKRIAASRNQMENIRLLADVQYSQVESLLEKLQEEYDKAI